MKKYIILFLLLVLTLSILAADLSQQEAKEALEEKGWMYGCLPVNWSLTQPERGGFQYAVMKGRVDIMELEKQAGLEITKCSKNLPVMAIFKNQPEALDFLLKNGFGVNDKYSGVSLLAFAISMKKDESVEVLLKNGANPNLETKGNYPLNLAIKKKLPIVVKMLLEAGAVPNSKTTKLLSKCKNEQIKSYFEEQY